MKKIKNYIRPACFFVLLLVFCSVIFYFSAQPAGVSDNTSGGVTHRVLSVIYPGFAEMDDAGQYELVKKYDNAVRETAHFIEFIPLGFFAAMSLEGVLPKRKYAYSTAGAFGVLYAISDEVHQYFVPGRSSQLIDVIIDSGGALTGVLVAYLTLLAVGKIRERNMRRKKSPDTTAHS